MDSKEQADTIKKPIVALYLRVSTSAQDKEMQRFELNEKTVELGAEIYKEYTDKITGASQVSERQYAPDVIEDARTKKFEILLVWAVDRIARDEEFGLNYLRRIEETGCRIMFKIDEDCDTPVPYSEERAERVKDNRVDALKRARGELRKIKARTRASKRQWILSGKWPGGGGHVPYGYKLTDDYGLEIVPEHAEVIRRIFRMYIDENHPVRKIVAILNEEGIPSLTPNGWKKDRIQKIFHNTVYIGYLKIKGKMGVEYTFYCDPIVSEETFKKIDDKTQERRERSRRNATREYPFKGYLKCDMCGFPLRSMKNGADESFSYGFTRRPSDGRVIKEKRCSGRGCGTVSQRNLVEALYDDFIKFLVYSSAEELRDWIKSNKDIDPNEEVQRRIVETGNELKLLEDKAERIMDIAFDSTSPLAKDKCKKELAILEPRIESKRDSLRTLRMRLLNDAESQEKADEIVETAIWLKEIFAPDAVLPKRNYEVKKELVLATLPLIQVIRVNFNKAHLVVYLKEALNNKPRIVELLGGGNKGNNGNNGNGPESGSSKTQLRLHQRTQVTYIADLFSKLN